MSNPLRITLLIIGLAVAIFIVVDVAFAQPAPPDHGAGTDAECAQYGCLYAHDRCAEHYSRSGARECTVEYGIASQRLPDGEDDRRFVEVLWPEIKPGVRYMPHRRAEWDRLANCESTLRWHINNGNGYHGGIQFHPQTWRAYGGQQFAAYAFQATPEQQITIGERVLWAGHGPHGPQGRGAWPGCLHKGRGAPPPP